MAAAWLPIEQLGLGGYGAPCLDDEAGGLVPAGENAHPQQVGGRPVNDQQPGGGDAPRRVTQQPQPVDAHELQAGQVDRVSPDSASNTSRARAT